MLALFDLIDALHQPPRLGVVPLTPALVDALVGLLDLVVAAHPRHTMRRSLSNRASGLDLSVRARAMKVRDSLLTAAGRLSGLRPHADVGGTSHMIEIVWPEVQAAVIVHGNDDTVGAKAHVPLESIASDVLQSEQATEQEAAPGGTATTEIQDNE